MSRCTDDGRAAPAPARRGHGLVGMRERAGVYGGELSAGPAAGGGWRVRADLPAAGGARREHPGPAGRRPAAAAHRASG